MVFLRGSNLWMLLSSTEALSLWPDSATFLMLWRHFHGWEGTDTGGDPPSVPAVAGIGFWLAEAVSDAWPNPGPRNSSSTEAFDVDWLFNLDQITLVFLSYCLNGSTMSASVWWEPLCALGSTRWQGGSSFTLSLSLQITKIKKKKDTGASQGKALEHVKWKELHNVFSNHKQLKHEITELVTNPWFPVTKMYVRKVKIHVLKKILYFWYCQGSGWEKCTVCQRSNIW